MKIPNVATDTVNIRKNAEFLVQFMNARRISDVQLLEADDKNVPPVVYGAIKVPGATETVIFYAHYDGQPVNPALWANGLHPFQPQLVSGRIDEEGSIQTSVNFPVNDNWRTYARGASDDKAGVMAILNAFTAIKESGLKFPYNIKFFFEGEEEQGSTHLHQILDKYRSQLQSDLWIICDGPVHQSGRKQIVFGARGDAHLTLKVYGPKNPLHSGHYGNWVPNPVMILSKLLASMKDDNGRVAIKDFYNDVIPLSATEKQALKNIPAVDEELKKKIGFAKEEMNGKSLMESINLPSLNVNGIESSNVGTIQANVIPISATAVIDLRLVLGNDWKRQQQKVIDHIIKQGFYVTENELTVFDILTRPGPDLTPEEREEVKKVARQLLQRVKSALVLNWRQKAQARAQVRLGIEDVLDEGLPRVYSPELYRQKCSALNAKFLIDPIANYDNNQHAENENIKLRNFWEGIDMMAAIMLMKF